MEKLRANFGALRRPVKQYGAGPERQRPQYHQDSAAVASTRTTTFDKPAAAPRRRGLQRRPERLEPEL